MLSFSSAFKTVLERMVREGVPSAYVFEDDVIFHQDLESVFPMVRVLSAQGGSYGKG